MSRMTTHARRPLRAARPLGRVSGGAALALAAVLALGGCQSLGGDDDAGPAVQPTPTSPDDPVTSDPSAVPTPSPTDTVPAMPVPADLTVTVDATGEGATTTFTLTCEPVGGDHPDADAACAAIAAAGGTAAFEPTSPGVACTEQWGGPQTATVTGTVDGTRVDADFSRINGCEISRWDRLDALFGPDAGLM